MSYMRRKIVVGNWKMHGSLTENQVLLGKLSSGSEGLGNMDCAVCVPYPYLYQTQSLLHDSRVAWGAQNLSQHSKGAFTGEVSAIMLRDFGCRYVIVGHSERRSLYGEDSKTVAQKYQSAQEAKLIPILCLGETSAEREQSVTEATVSSQLDAVIAQCGIESLYSAIVAYEPVWAIGTGKTATPQQAQDVHAFIRSKIAARAPAVAEEVKILYGGSVKGSNSRELFSMPDIDGGLIGGASLVAEEFLSICNSAQV
jgi:triosephosphate isomerase